MFSIKNEAFEFCESLEKIDIPKSNSYVGKEAFRSCKSLQEIELSEAMTNIGTNAFLNCPELSKLTILSKNAEISNHAAGYHFNNDTGRYEPQGNVTIYGYYESTAQKYAEKNNLTFFELNSNPSDVRTVITLDKSTIELMQYRKVKLGFKVENPGGSTKFESTNSSVVTVDSDGNIEAVSPGKAYIAVTNGDATAVVTVVVSASKVDLKHEQSNSEYKFFFFDDNGDVCVRVTKYIGTKSVVKIPSEIGGYPVRVIDEYAFMNCSTLINLTIPEGVTKLGYGAFRACKKLKTIKFPSTITELEGFEFEDVSTVESIDFPSIKALLEYCKYDDVSSSLPVYNPHTLLINGKSVKNLTIPNGTETIFGEMFRNCINIETVTLPDGLKQIGFYSFADCTALKSFNVPESVEVFGSGALYNCPKIEGIKLPDGLRQLGSNALLGTSVKSLTIPEYARVYNYAFQDFTTLETVYFNLRILPDEYDNLFKNCDSLKSFYISKNAAEFDTSMFKNTAAKPVIYGFAGTFAENLAKKLGFKFVALEESVTEPDVTEPAPEPTAPQIPIFPDYLYDPDTLTYTVTDKAGALKGEDDYPSAESNNATTVVFDYDEPVRLTSWCTQWFMSVEKAVVKGNIYDIGSTAFQFCARSLKEVELSDNVVSITYGAFSGCKLLTKVPEGKGLRLIGDYAFSSCEGLTEINICPSVTEIGECAFLGCKGVSEVKIPSTVTKIGGYAFGYLYNFTQDEYFPIPNFKIIAEKGSEGERYAIENDLILQYPNGEFYNPAESSEVKPTEPKPAAPTVKKPIVKKSNPIKVTAVKKTVKAKTLRKKMLTIKALTVKKAQGKLTFKKLSGKKFFKVSSKTGKITIKKKTPKGTYKIKVKITAAGNTRYKKKSLTKTVQVRIK